ncbi:hypothetical protein PIB30_067847 [Stylosanthes scabra]|uniref:Uncharacterized protein n=1 Tax=Stylosanthes scabra TaxID=79078 RepID=A0ABU6YPK2_9FABA|nr:hypothetical protein [Stylosanthes scabra]
MENQKQMKHSTLACYSHRGESSAQFGNNGSYRNGFTVCASIRTLFIVFSLLSLSTSVSSICASITSKLLLPHQRPLSLLPSGFISFSHFVSVSVSLLWFPVA